MNTSARPRKEKVKSFMPYKNPEHKRQWEREHRQRRNMQRRQRQLETRSIPTILKKSPDPAPVKQPGSGWGALAAVAVGVGIALVGAFAGINLPNSERDQ
jgi:ferric-dicitrate binding protein FerR (iron transport regulator)